jgi:hypothetical protein
VILFFGCVAKLGVDGVERSALVRAFQRTKECWNEWIKSYDHLKLLV